MSQPKLDSNRRIRLARGGVAAAACLVVVVWTALAADTPSRPVHRDGKAMGRTTLAVSRGLILEDVEAVRKGLAELAEYSPALKPEDKEIFGEDVYNGDRAMQMTILRAREYATLGDIGKMFDEYVWVQRTCLNCHRVCREQGLLPAAGPIGSID